MHMHLQEIVAARQVAEQSRYDIYARIHKGIRSRFVDVLVQAGRVDTDDTAAVSALVSAVGTLCGLCELHLAHENAFVHPALEQAQPGTSQRIAAEHAEHQRDLHALGSCAAALQSCTPAERPAAAHTLYLALSLFVAHNLVHMYLEETEHNAVLWTHYSDAEILAIEQRLVAHLAPQEAMAAMAIMIPAVSPRERVFMLAGMRASAPEPAFQAVIGRARDALPAPDFAALERALALP